MAGKKDSKLKSAIVHICHTFKETPKKLGSVKLHKILWFSDVMSLKERYKTITGMTGYIARRLGPVVPNIREIIAELANEGVISSKKNFIGNQQRMYDITDEKMALDYIKQLDDDDKRILDHWIDYAQDRTVQEIVHTAHSYTWWSKMKIGKPVPVHLGALKSQDTVING